MSSTTRTWVLLAVTAILCCLPEASGTGFTCGNTVLPRPYAVCKDLPALSASFAWTLNASSNSIDFSFSGEMSDASGWVAWGINPGSQAEMIGTQALGAFRSVDGATTVRTYNVTGPVKDNARLLVQGPVSVAYFNVSAALVTTTMTISGTVKLAAGQSVLLNHVWNRGARVVATSAALLGHPVSNENLASAAVIDMATGQATAQDVPNKRRKDIHGAINAISWGILLPIGAMAARYLRPFKFADPAWFYLHVFCQIAGYAGGTAGWVLGLQLQKDANPIKYKHRNLGIAIWAIATFQILAAVLLRPKPGTKRRPFWNVMHHTLGYAIIIISIINIFEGIDLLGEDKWMRIYIIILVVLAIIAIVLELITWFVWFQKRSRRHKHCALVGDI